MNKILLLILFILSIFIKSIAQDIGFVLIKSSPSNAKVIINGEDTGKETTFQKQLSVGVYSYQLSLNDYNTYNGEFEVKPNETTSLQIQLTPNFGMLKVTSIPNDANVYLDNILIGKTPLTKKKIPSGSHQIRIEKEMYNPTSEIIQIEDKKTTIKQYELQAGFGTIGIITNPVADILIDGEIVGNNTYTGRLSSGNHIVEAKRERYYPQKKEVSIEEADEQKILFRLEPKIGKLSVMTEPPEAKITLKENNNNNKSFINATSPKVISDLLVGDYSLTLEKDGYAPILKNITINENKTFFINEKLFSGVLVDVSTIPSDAEIWIDNEFKGKSPLQIPLEKKEYFIEVRNKEFYANERKNVKISTSGQKLNFVLKPESGALVLQTNPKKAQYKIKGLSKNGITNDTLLDFEYGEYKVEFLKRGYTILSKSIVVDKPKNVYSFTLTPEQFRTKDKAVLLSAIIPGAGQSYLTRGKPYWLFSTAFYGFAAGSLIQNQKAIDNYDLYIEESNSDLRQEYKSSWEQQHKTSRTLGFTAGGIWIANMIWTLAMPSEEKKYKKVGLTYYLNPEIQASGIGLSYKF